MSPLTLNQLIEIAKSGFPERCRKLIDFDNLTFMKHGDTYRLHSKEAKFDSIYPNESVLTLTLIQSEKFIQFTVGNKAFNHYKAIMKMVEMGLIDWHKKSNRISEFFKSFTEKFGFDSQDLIDGDED